MSREWEDSPEAEQMRSQMEQDAYENAKATSPPTLRHLAERSLRDADAQQVYSYALAARAGLLALLDERDAHAQQIATLRSEADEWARKASSREVWCEKVLAETLETRKRAEAAEARATTAERELDEAREQVKYEIQLSQQRLAETTRLQGELDAAKSEIDAAWFNIEHGYDIESRAALEAQAKTNGYRYGLAQAVMHIHKRDPKVDAAISDTLDRVISVVRNYNADLIVDFDRAKREPLEGRLDALRLVTPSGVREVRFVGHRSGSLKPRWIKPCSQCGSRRKSPNSARCKDHQKRMAVASLMNLKGYRPKPSVEA